MRRYVFHNLKLSNDISIIANNCVGGVLYHDLGWKFLSPTINCYFMADDYVRYLSNLSFYNSADVSGEINAETGTVLLKIHDITLHFIHDTDVEKVISDWYRRRERINPDKLFIIASDRDGWSDETMEIFKSLPYENKCFFTTNEKWKNEPYSIYFKIYSKEPYFPEVISSRGHYMRLKMLKLMENLK